MNRYAQMRTEWLRFDRQHPEVWALFVRFALEARDRGLLNCGVALIWERMRWETAVNPAYRQMGDFKLNNNYRAFYARRLMAEDPSFDGFFRLREQTSRGADACAWGPLGPSDFPEVKQKNLDG